MFASDNNWLLAQSDTPCSDQYVINEFTLDLVIFTMAVSCWRTRAKLAMAVCYGVIAALILFEEEILLGLFCQCEFSLYGGCVTRK
jgi:hypothetical protein